MPDHLSRSVASEQPTREVITANGHDVAGGHSTPRWRTPSGKMLVEGKQYQVERRYVFAATRITGSYELLRYRRQLFVVSEALETAPPKPVGADGREHTPRGRSGDRDT